MNTSRRAATLHEEFERVAARFAQRTAVVDEENSLSYAELDRKADRVAYELRSNGVSGGLVGLSTLRSVDLVVGILAILKAGAAYVPIDPDLPAERRRHIAQDSGMAAVVTDSAETVRTADGLPVVVVGEVSDAGPVLAHENRGEAGLAYVIYTSGSTGIPKGVLVEHRQVLSLFDGADEVFDFGPDDTWTLFHSYAFDFSVWEIFGALLHGGCLVVVPNAVARSPEAMWRLIQREDVTVLNQTPSYFAQLSNADQGFGHHLRYMVFGGEALEFSRLRGWFERYGHSGPQLVNMYGITETTVHVTHRQLAPEDVDDSRSVIGRPLPHLTVRLLGPDLRPVAPGEVGEICVGGAGLARGYLGRDDLTAERFVTDPGRPGNRLYRSGDLGRLLDSGEIEYVGRSDEQVKVRGYRIEPAEIRHRLRQHDGIADVAVTVRRSAESGSQLVAYVVPVPGVPVPTAAELRQHLGRSLPGYMVPSWFVPLAALPVTHNGKLDVSALPAPGTAAARAEAAPTDRPELLTRLREIWLNVLELDALATDDRFYAVGGDSIRAIRIVVAAQAADLPVTVDDLLGNPNLEVLARIVAERAGTGPEPRTEAGALLSPEDRAAIRPGVSDAYPLTALQLGMLLHSEENGPGFYHSVSSATVLMAFDPDRMRGALRRAVQRHETLRVSFDLASHSVPLQLVAESAEPALVVTDLSGLGPRARQEAVAALVQQEQAEPLDWRQAPMARFRVAVLGPDSFLFVWSEHHAVLDGWSSNSLFAEVVADLAGLAETDRATELPPLRDHVAAEQAAVADPEAGTFWAEYLDRVPAGLVGATAHDQADEVALALPAGTYSGLEKVAHGAELTPKDLLTAVVAAAIGIHRGLPEAVVGHVAHSRLARPGGEQVLGLFLNTLPLRIGVSGSLHDMAQAVSKAVRTANRYRHYPLSAIQRATRGEFRLDNIFNFTDFHQLEPLTRSGLIDRDGVRNTTWTNFPLVVEAERRPGDGELAVVVQFRSAHWNPAARAAFLSTLEALLRQAVEEPRAVLPGHPADSAATVLTDIAARAELHPGRVAVSAAQGSLTYAQLMSRVKKLAALLEARGVTGGSTVAVRLPRTADLLVAALAVFWAGGVLVPLEADHPSERQRFILDDAKVELILDGAEPDGGAPGIPVLRVGAIGWDELHDDPAARPRCSPDDSAYVLYTSGSTGHPKGVTVTHANLRTLMRSVAGTIGLTADDVVLGWTSVMFDIFLVEQIAALQAGARVELLADDEVREPARVRARCLEAGVTIVQSTPSKAQTLLDIGFPHVRIVLCGGEPMAPSLADDLLATGAAVWNGYGPTEATVYTTMHRAAEGRTGPVPIGRPLPGVELRVVDTSGQDVPAGTTGELWIGGAGVARGYLGRPDLTAERFVEVGATRYYRSGDLVRENPEGELEFHGRLDQQVKVNGVRTEVSEIEHALTEHPAVRGAVVVLRPGTAGIGLTAYVRVGTLSVDPVELREHLAVRVPAAMIPTSWRFIGEFPLTAGGKVDRRRLTDGCAPVAPAVPVAGTPITEPDEQLVASVWAALLGTAPVHREDRFADLGGDSLTAMLAVGQYARRGIAVRAADLMNHTTVAAQAALVASARTALDEPKATE
ncbi:amino acid adenylation domain-containing protein [Kitasatospora cineracea]|uniref:amino acid adenylation domain-containing protein n=1 Tax=Kitasatospora cineracea TaxID=88074 RepID=UPI0033D94C53